MECSLPNTRVKKNRDGPGFQSPKISRQESLHWFHVPE